MIHKILSINHIADSPLSIQELSGFDTAAGPAAGPENTPAGGHFVYSVRNVLTGLAEAARRVSNPITEKAIVTMMDPVRKKVQMLTVIR